jgi:hypothetical protein
MQRNDIYDWMKPENRLISMLISKKDKKNISFHRNSLITERNMEFLVTDKGISINNS